MAQTKVERAAKARAARKAKKEGVEVKAKTVEETVEEESSELLDTMRDKVVDLTEKITALTLLVSDLSSRTDDLEIEFDELGKPTDIKKELSETFQVVAKYLGK